MAKTDSSEALLKQLKNPFEQRLVKFRQGGRGSQLAYIDARDVMKRLDDLVGVAGWQDKYFQVDGGIICELSIKIGDEWITKSNGSNNTKIEPVKGGVSGALKRAAVNFGIGRYLYYLPSWATPNNHDQWPEWAKPDNDLENWEDIAEMEAEIDTGMDEEDVISVKTADYISQINAAESKDSLDEILKEIPADQRLVLADVIANKRDSL